MHVNCFWARFVYLPFPMAGAGDGRSRCLPHWMRPAQLHTHKGTIIMRLLVVLLMGECVCLGLGRASSIFPDATLFSIQLRWWKAIHMHTRPQAHIPLEFKHFYLVPKLLCNGCQRAAHHVNANGEHEIQTLCAKCVIIIITIIISSTLLKWEFSTNIRTLRQCKRKLWTRYGGERHFDESRDTGKLECGNGKMCFFLLSFGGCECESSNWNGEIIKIYTKNILFAFGDGSNSPCMHRTALSCERPSKRNES